MTLHWRIQVGGLHPPPPPPPPPLLAAQRRAETGKTVYLVRCEQLAPPPLPPQQNPGPSQL